MTPNIAARVLPLDSPLLWIAIVASTALLAIGLRAVRAPASAAAGFGIPLDEGKGLAFVQAFGARNIGLSLFALTAIFLDERRSVAVLFVSAAVIAAIDAMIVRQHTSGGRPVMRPALIALILVIVGFLLLR